MDEVMVIAEIGINHNGDIETAKRLIESAKECGADAVKFQTFDVRELVSGHARMADYQKKNTGTEGTQASMLEQYALGQDEFIWLKEYCGKAGILFLSSPFDIPSIRFLDGLQELWKIPSGEVTDYPYLVEIARTGKAVILSTGMATLDEIRKAWDILKENGCGRITLMQCTTEYPTPLSEVNLRAMATLEREFGCRVGYSDHTDGISVAGAAVAMGAKIIEKHFTLDRSMAGPDHKASLEPNMFRKMVGSIRDIEMALGDGRKHPTESELRNRTAARKSIIASEPIRKGEILATGNITTKRPGNGISPMLWEKVIGTRAIRDFTEDELIEI